MKGTEYNGSYFSNFGTSRSEGEAMFSVGGLVAFSYSHYSSPDGRSYKSGCIPSSRGYLLQEEISLEEYDHTESNAYGSGQCKEMKIVELSEEFWHEFSTNLETKIFLLQILETEKNIFDGGFISGDISEVRNHPGKYLHIYPIPERYWECHEVGFEITVEKINLQKKQEDDFATEKVTKNFRGVDLIFGVTCSGWYQSSASFGEFSVERQHEHDSTRRVHSNLFIMPSVPDGYYEFYWGETPMFLYLKEGQEPSIDTITKSSWCNSQDWYYCKIKTLSIQKGWIFINGKDVFENTKKIINEMNLAQKNARIKRFEELSKSVTERYGEEILKLVLRKKGKVLSFLEALSLESYPKIENINEIMKIISISQSWEDVLNLINFASKGIDPQKAGVIANKAYAWAYLYKAFPEIKFIGNFDEASGALSLYSKNREKLSVKTESDLSIKLREAGLADNISE